MSKTKIILISDDEMAIQKSRTFAYSLGLDIEIYSPMEWEKQSKADNESYGQSVHHLISGNNNTLHGQPQNNVIPFPQNQVQSKRVHTIEELESIAIEKAIYEFNGNLTEAAKALGIGRATLYRKVKQYNIDPDKARKKRAA